MLVDLNTYKHDVLKKCVNIDVDRCQFRKAFIMDCQCWRCDLVSSIVLYIIYQVYGNGEAIVSYNTRSQDGDIETIPIRIDMSDTDNPTIDDTYRDFSDTTYGIINTMTVISQMLNSTYIRYRIFGYKQKTKSIVLWIDADDGVMYGFVSVEGFVQDQKFDLDL